jgi:hypothetical protein
MLNGSTFDWNDMKDLQEIGLIALMFPEAVQRLFEPDSDANRNAGNPREKGGQEDGLQRGAPESRAAG